MTAELEFKKGAYQYYAPLLYKCYRLKARLKCATWQLSRSNLDELAQFYWDGYLVAKFEQELNRRGMPVYQLPLVSSKKNKQAYILGCGSSINQVSSEQWQYISENFSASLNNFYVHDFTPDVYFCEFVNNADFLKIIYKYLLDNQARRDARVCLSGRNILLRGQGYRVPKVSEPEFYVVQSVKCTSLALLKRMVAADTYFSSKNLLHHISNLDTVIQYCVREGYRDITLVGIDLNDDGYFWDAEDTQPYRDVKDFIISFQRQVNYKKNSQGVHITASTEVARKLGKLTIVEYLTFVQKQILQPRGISLWVANENSLLARVLKVKPIGQDGP